jgi:hypothetical protein
MTRIIRIFAILNRVKPHHPLDPWSISLFFWSCKNIMNSTKQAREELHEEPIQILGEVGGNGMDAPENLNLDSEPEIESISKWQRFEHATGFTALTASLCFLFLVTTLALAAWMFALHNRHRAEIEKIQLDYQIESSKKMEAALTEPATPENLQERIDEAQKQMALLQASVNSSNAEQVLSNQELLGIQNNTLQKELEDVAKAHLDAPIIDFDPALAVPLAAAAKPEAAPVTAVNVPLTSSVFTLIFHQPADKPYPAYGIEILEPKKNKILWAAQKAADGIPKISVTMMKRSYPNGKYRVRLMGVSGKKKDVLESHDIEVKYIPPPKGKPIPKGKKK